jgi:hypothetical protein
MFKVSECRLVGAETGFHKDLMAKESNQEQDFYGKGTKQIYVGSSLVPLNV